MSSTTPSARKRTSFRPGGTADTGREGIQVKFDFKADTNAIVFLLCGLVFIAASALTVWSGSQLKFSDELIYTQMANRLADGLGFVSESLQPTAYRPPGYPYIISLVFRVHESILLAKFLNVIALTATTWLVSSIVRSVTPGGQVFAPLLILAYPLFTYTSSLLYPQIVGSFLFVLAMYLTMRHPGSLPAGLACGFTFGILILVIPSFALVFVCMFALMAISNCFTRFYSVRFLSAFLVVTLFVVSLWIIRSSLLFDRFVFISTNSGINLLYGNSENTGYNTGVVDVSQYSVPEGLDEAGLDSYFKKCAKEWVFDHPTEAAGLYLKKTANYFNFKNKLSTTSEASLSKDILMGVTYYPLLVAVLVRCFLWRTYRFSWPELLMYLLYFGNAFLSAIVYTRIRYRIPFDFLLIAMVAVFIGHFLANRPRRTA